MTRFFSGLGLNVGLYLYRGWQILVFAVIPAALVAVAGYFYAKQQPQSYQATTTLYVQQAPSAASPLSTGSDATSGAQLAATYSQMIVSPALYKAVDKRMDKKYPGFHIAYDGVHAAQETAVLYSQLLDVSVTDPFPQRAVDATNVVAGVFTRRITALERSRFAADRASLQAQVDGIQADARSLTRQIVGYHGDPAGLTSLKTQLAADQSTFQSLEAALTSFRAASDAVVSNLNVYSPATAATPIGPHPSRNALIWGFLALLAFGALIYLYDYVNDLVRSPEEVEELTGAPVLGTVQAFGKGDPKGTLMVREHPHSTAAEAYRLIRTNLRFVAVDHPPRTIVISSALPGEGKSTTAGNLAQIFAEGGHRVRLVDSDLRRPSLHRHFGPSVSRREGLTTLLSSADLNGHGLQSTDHANLALIASGPIPPNPADLLASARMGAVVDHLLAEADLVILDSPPILAVADAAILSANSDGVVLVVDPMRTKRREIKQACEAIDAAGGKILGVVLNRLRPRGVLYYQYYGYYGYKYGYKTTYGGPGGKGSDPTTDRDQAALVAGGKSE